MRLLLLELAMNKREYSSCRGSIVRLRDMKEEPFPMDSCLARPLSMLLEPWPCAPSEEGPWDGFWD